MKWNKIVSGEREKAEKESQDKLKFGIKT